MAELADALRDLDGNKVYELVDQKVDQGVSVYVA
jgi:hypothetical protein